MINKIIRMLRRPPIAVRVSPHTRKLEFVPVIYLDTYDPSKHRDDTDYDPKQVGDLDGDPELGGDD
jgi:hypothetical protein